MMSPILYVELLRQSNYKISFLLSVMHKQKTYFSKKYSKVNRRTLGKCNRVINSKNVGMIKNVKLAKCIRNMRIVCVCKEPSLREWVYALHMKISNAIHDNTINTFDGHIYVQNTNLWRIMSGITYTIPCL